MYLFIAAAAGGHEDYARDVHKAKGNRADCGKTKTHVTKSLRLFGNLLSEIKLAALWLARMWSESIQHL